MSRTALAEGGLGVSPVRLDLTPGARATSMTVSNDGFLPKHLRVEPLRWTQSAGADHYEPSRDLIVNPAEFTLAPGARQIVRAGFRGGAPAAAQEQAYRIYLQEQPEDEGAAPVQLRLLLRIGVPLFVAPAATPQESPRWTLARQPSGERLLQLANGGNRRLRLSTLKLQDGAGQSFDLDGLAYVLAGQQRQWPVPPAAQGALRVAGESDQGALDVVLASP